MKVILHDLDYDPWKKLNLEQQIDTSQTWYNTQDIIESNEEIDNNNKQKENR
jgi:hypothetical protein